jgi:putative redox protein
MSTMTVTFPGGKRVDAEYNGFTIRTDQPPRGGGEGSAPQPFDLFLASIATCAGIYVKGYCDTRDIATEGLGLEMRVERDDGAAAASGSSCSRSGCRRGSPRSTATRVVRAADLCSVKKHIFDPPAIEIRTA